MKLNCMPLTLCLQQHRKGRRVTPSRAGFSLARWLSRIVLAYRVSRSGLLLLCSSTPSVLVVPPFQSPPLRHGLTTSASSLQPSSPDSLLLAGSSDVTDISGFAFGRASNRSKYSSFPTRSNSPAFIDDHAYPCQWSFDVCVQGTMCCTSSLLGHTPISRLLLPRWRFRLLPKLSYIDCTCFDLSLFQPELQIRQFSSTRANCFLVSRSVDFLCQLDRISHSRSEPVLLHPSACAASMLLGPWACSATILFRLLIRSASMLFHPSTCSGSVSLRYRLVLLQFCSAR